TDVDPNTAVYVPAQESSDPVSRTGINRPRCGYAWDNFNLNLKENYHGFIESSHIDRKSGQGSRVALYRRRGCRMLRIYCYESPLEGQGQRRAPRRNRMASRGVLWPTGRSGRRVSAQRP